MKADTSSDDSSLYSAHRYDPDAYPADIDLAKKHGVSHLKFSNN